jgi:hypothetical protein
MIHDLKGWSTMFSKLARSAQLKLGSFKAVHFIDAFWLRALSLEKNRCKGTRCWSAG